MRFLALITAMATLFCFSACGNDQNNSVTKAEFVKEGNAICKRWQKGRGELFAKLNSRFQGKKLSSADKETAILALMRPYEKATSELAELRAPHGEGRKVKTMVAAMEEATKEAKADPEAAFESSAVFDKANTDVKKNGLEECVV